MSDGKQKRTYVIGRGGDIRLDHTSASRHHACLTVSDGAIALHDLDSHNGTFRIDGLDAVPFAGGEIFLDEVFAFSVCIRSVRQMLEEVGEAGSWPVSGERPERAPTIAQSASRAWPTDTLAGARIANVRAKISTLLTDAFAESAESAGCRTHNPNAGSRANTGESQANDQSIAALQHEVEALRKMLVSVCRERDAVQRISELSFERIELQNSLISRLDANNNAVDMNSTAELPAIEEPEAKLESLDGHVDLDRRYYHLSRNSGDS